MLKKIQGKEPVKNRPVKQWRSGSFKIALWENIREINGNEVGFKTISLSRSFKKRDEEIWRSEVINFRKMDIPKITSLLTELSRELYLESQQED